MYSLKYKIQGTTVSVREREMLKPVRSSIPDQLSVSFLDCLGYYFFFLKRESLDTHTHTKKSDSRHIGPIESDFQGKPHVNLE